MWPCGRWTAVRAGLALVMVAGVSGTGTAGVADAGPGVAVVRIVDLGTLPDGETSEAVDINDEGVVVGRSAGHAVRWDQSGRITDLGTLPGGLYSDAVAINDRGMIAGQATTVDGRYHLVLWDRAGRITDAGTLPGGTYFTPIAINDRGVVLGHGDAADGREHAATWQRRTGFTVLRPPAGGCCAQPSAINNRGVAVGGGDVRTDVRADVREVGAIRWDRAGEPAVLGAVSGMWTGAADVNDRGVAVGTAFRGGGAVRVPVRWDRRGRVGELRTPHGQGNALAINRAGVVAGVWLGAPDARAARWDRDGMMTDLGALPDFPSSFAVGLNDHGTVIGQATRWDAGRRFVAHAVRWEPDGRITDLGTLGGPESSVRAINGQGTAVGRAETADGRAHAVLWPAALGG